MAPTPIDAREWQATINYLRDYALLSRPHIAALVDHIDPTRPTPGALARWRDLQLITARLRAFHDEYKQVVAPPGSLDQHAYWTRAVQAADQQRITLSDPRITQHIGIFGPSGSTKTTFAQHLTFAAYERGISPLILDGKKDAEHFVISYPQTIVIAASTQIPFLEVPPWLALAEYIRLLERCIKRIWWGGIRLEQVVHESLARTYQRHDRPNVVNWRAETCALHQKGQTYSRTDSLDGLIGRQNALIDELPGIGTTYALMGVSPQDLCTRPVYFAYLTPGPVVDLIGNWLFELRFSYNRAHGVRSLNTLGLIDESHLFVHEDTINHTASFGTTFPLLREFGIGIALTSTHDELPTILRANIGTHVVMRVSDAESAASLARTLGLKERGQLSELIPGECLIRTPDWPHTIRATFPPLAVNKQVAREDWEHAITRTNRRARTSDAVMTIAVNPPMQPAAEITPTTPALAEESAGRSTTNGNTRVRQQKVALNRHEASILRAAAEAGVTTTSEVSRKTGTHPQATARAKTGLIAKGLIEEERITVFRKRGGTAVCIRPTASGYARAGVKRHGTRGGDSVQHEYLARALRKKIVGASLDVMVGTKAVDVLVPYNAAVHERLAKYLRIAPVDGALIGIEVEVSDPRRTAANNIARNADAGVTHTVIATMTPLRRTPVGALVVDVFALLEAL